MSQTRCIFLLLLSQLVAVSLSAHTIRPLTDVRYEALARDSGVVLSDGSVFLVLSGDRVFRIDSSGQVIDPVARRIPVPPDTFSPPVGIWTGSSYLLVWRTSRGLIVFRLDRDGNPIEGSERTIVGTYVSGYGNPPSIVRTGENFVLVYRTEGGLYVLRLDSEGSRIGAEIQLSHNTTDPSSVASLGAVALVGAFEWIPFSGSRWRAWEIDGGTGEIRDSPVGKLSVSGTPRLIGTSRGAVLVWVVGRRLQTAAIDSRGEVTDRHVIEQEIEELEIVRGVSTSDSVYLLGTLYGPPPRYGYRATAVLNLDGSERRPWIETIPLFTETIASNGSRVIVAGLAPAGVQLAAAAAWILEDGSLSSRISYPRLPNSQSLPSIGCAAGECLVAWQEDASDGSQSIRSMRVDDRGKPVNGSESTLAPRGGAYPSVAQSELESLVVWQQVRSQYYWPYSGAIHGRRVTQDGSPTGPVIIVSEAFDAGTVTLTSDGDSWLVVWIDDIQSPRAGLMARRVLRNGTMTDPVRLTGVSNVSHVGSVVWTGNEYAVVFGDARLCNLSSCPQPNNSVWFVPFSKNGQQIGEPKRLARGDVSAPRLGISTAGLFVTWSDAQVTRAAQIDHAGNLLGDLMTWPVAVRGLIDTLLSTGNRPGDGTPLPVDRGSGPIASNGALFYFVETTTTPAPRRLGHVGISAKGDVSSIGFPVTGSDGLIATTATDSLQFVVAETEPYGVPRLATFRQNHGDEGIDLRLSAEGIDTQIPADSQRIVTLTLSNQGTSTATEVVMNGSTGSGIAEIIDSDGGICTVTLGTLQCTWERLDAGAVRRVRLQVGFQLYGYRPPPQSSRALRATVGAHETDARGSDNILDLPYVVFRTPQKLRGARR